MRKDFNYYLKQTIGILILLTLSAVFLFSAGTKLMAMEPFEWTFLEILPVSFTGAAIIARLFIGLEIGIALFLLAHLYLKSYTYKAAFALLVLLTGYLLLLIAKQGNSGNCGCFGDTYQMTPLAAIIKNVFMMAGLAITWAIYPGKPYRAQRWITIGATIAALGLPYALAPVYLFGTGEAARQPISLNAINDYGVPKPTVDLKNGKHIVAFLSLTCPHCRKAAYLIQLLHRKYPDYPFYIVLNGRKERDAAFFGETKSIKVPHSIIREIPPFEAMAGEFVPAIYWINNSVIERKTYYIELDPAAIKSWLDGRKN